MESEEQPALSEPEPEPAPEPEPEPQPELLARVSSSCATARAKSVLPHSPSVASQGLGARGNILDFVHTEAGTSKG